MIEGKVPMHNSALKISSFLSPLDSFVVTESSILRNNFFYEKPAI
jgi:hypothetical protein